MHTQDGMRMSRTALALLGAAALILGGLTEAHAQSGTMSGGRQGRGGRMSRKGTGKDSGKTATIGDAMSGKALMDDTSGFANFYTGLDKDNQMGLREVYAENIDRMYPNEEDPVFIEPAPWNYPAAAPGAIDTYHYADFTQDHLIEGSTYDTYVRKARLAAAREKAFMRRAMMLRQQLSRSPGGMMSGGMRSSNP